MSYSYSYTETETFTVTHARLIASKVSTDLLRFQRFYDKPSNETIDQYEEELTQLLKYDYLDAVTYGFKRDGKWVEAIKYHAVAGGQLVSDDDPGKIRPGIDVSGAAFTSFLTRNNNWWKLSTAEREKFEKNLPFQRTSGEEPGLESGYWAEDKTYAAGGRGVSRNTIRRV